MSCSDPIADFMTCIRNAYMTSADIVEAPSSKIKSEITRILKREGFINDFVVEGGVKKILRIYLKYDSKHKPVIRGLRRESKGGLRKYFTAKNIPSVQGGMGITILSTSTGVITGKEAKDRGVGGELLCSVW